MNVTFYWYLKDGDSFGCSESDFFHEAWNGIPNEAYVFVYSGSHDRWGIKRDNCWITVLKKHHPPNFLMHLLLLGVPTG